MKQVVDRQLLKVKGKMIELYKMKDNTYKAFAFKNYDTEDEICGVGESDDSQSAIKLALQDLYVEVKK